MNRRKFVKSTIGLGALGCFTGLYSWQIEPFWPEVTHVSMPIKQLPHTLVGKKLVQISDMHVGNAFDYTYIIEALQGAKNLNPDFVVYTGDYVSYESEEQLEQLNSVLQQGALHGNMATLAILGNHDYGHQWEDPQVAQSICNVLSNHKINVLRNEMFYANGLNFIGIDDYWGTNYNPEAVTMAINHDIANVVLCHNPDVADEPVWNGYKGWILSGHTHGGQCKPPFLAPPILPVKKKNYTAGRIPLDDGRTLYINRALGHLWQIRFNVRPEITCFTLEQA